LFIERKDRDLDPKRRLTFFLFNLMSIISGCMFAVQMLFLYNLSRFFGGISGWICRKEGWWRENGKQKGNLKN
jgi:hypothetical protein